jgi:hypothetical protein
MIASAAQRAYSRSGLVARCDIRSSYALCLAQPERSWMMNDGYMLQEVPGLGKAPRKLPPLPFGMSPKTFSKLLLVVGTLFSIALLIINGHR